MCRRLSTEGGHMTTPRPRDAEHDPAFTRHPDADKGLIPESEWMPDTATGIEDWGDHTTTPLFSKRETRAAIVAGRKRAGLRPLTKAELDERLADRE